MVKPLVVIRRQTLQLGEVAQREMLVQRVVVVDCGHQRSKFHRRGVAGADPAEDLAQGERRQRPMEVEAELKGAPLIGPTLVALVGGDEGGAMARSASGASVAAVHCVAPK